MVKKSKPPTEHFENTSSDSHKELFSEDAAAGHRDPFHGSPAERAEQHNLEVEQQLKKEAHKDGVPVPTGEGENIHEDDPKLPKDSEASSVKEQEPESQKE